MNTAKRLSSMLVLTWLFATAPALAADEGAFTIWTRKNGVYAENENPDKLKPKTYNLKKLKKTTVKLFDIQYGAEKNYRGFWLDTLIAKYPAPPSGDLILLHFANGMIIPLPADPAARRAQKVFVALEIAETPGQWQGDFKTVEKKSLTFKSPLPINFSGNKVVISSKTYTALGSETYAAGDFLPWLQTNSLTGVEYANREAYYKQFNFGVTPDVTAGQRVFERRCQFCHGVQKIGASYGWDYVTPLKIYEKRQPQDLYYHAKYPKAKNAYFDTQMPNQQGFTLAEAQSLWKWMKAAAEQNAPPYKNN